VIVDRSLWLAIAGGIAIAAACGLRAFLPLLVVGIAGRLGAITLDDSVIWLTHSTVLWALGAATVTEIVGDKIPVVDHFLDLAATVVRPAAGALAAYAAIAHWPEPLPLVFALVAGTGALGVHAIKAKTRVGSTLLTAGAGNPLLSFAEDIGSLGLAGLGVLVPVLALLMLTTGALAIAGISRALRRRR
jgi:hypothetical protein